MSDIKRVVDKKAYYLKVELENGAVVERKGGTVAWRCNNPGNLKDGNFSRAHGSVGRDHIGHAVFPNKEVGHKAHVALLFNENSPYYRLTLIDAVRRYAPAGDANNNPDQYQRYITRKTGIERHDVLKTFTISQRDEMVKCMQRFEGWKAGNVKVIKEGKEEDDDVG